MNEPIEFRADRFFRETQTRICAALESAEAESATTAYQAVRGTAVRVPVFFGHSEVINIETRKKLSAAEARKILEKAPGITVMDERVPGGYPTAATEAANHDTVYVGRIREDISHERGLNLWVVSDNVRKGAATNSVQIAEILVREYL